MFPDLRKKFFIITPSLASAFPEATTTITSSTPSATTLPASLQSLVPQCAQACLAYVLYDEFPLSCSTSGDLECLCSKYSTSGLTLGEAAYACAVTSCPSSTANLTSTYGICSGQDGAVAATHSTLTFTAHHTSTAAGSSLGASSATATSVTSSRTNTTSTHHSSTSSSSTSTTSRSTSETSALVTSDTTAAASSTSAQPAASSSAAAAGAASGNGGGLSTAQVVGISVASVSAVVLAAGVLFLMACLRKRDRKKHEDLSEKNDRSMFGLTPPSHDHVVMSPTALEQFPSPPRLRRDPRPGGVGIGIPQVRVEAASPPQRKRAPTPLESIGLAISEDAPASPASFHSTRTVSQLLPDKPEPVVAAARQVPVVAAAKAPPQAKKKSARPDSEMSQGTLFEEDTAVRRSMYPVRAVEVTPRQSPAAPYRPHPAGPRPQPHPQPHPQPRPQPRPQPPPIMPPVRPYRPPPRFAQDYTMSPESMRQPPLSLKIPPQGRVYPRVPTPSPPPIPSPLRIAKPPAAHRAGPSPIQQVPPVPLPPGPTSASSGSTKFTGTNSSASDSYIPAYYTSPPTSILQTPPESYGRGSGTGFGGPPPQASNRSPPRQPPIQAASSSPPRQAQTTPAPQTAGQGLSQSRGGPPVYVNPPVQMPPQQRSQHAYPPPPAQYQAYSLPPPPPVPQSDPARPQKQGQQGTQQQQGERPRPPPMPTQRPQRSTSSASMTSFESASPDDDSTPPEDATSQNKRLVPVPSAAASGPASGAASVITVVPPPPPPIKTTPPMAGSGDDTSDKSPISDIKYPKIPRASNEAVPRTPEARLGTPSPRIGAHQGASPNQGSGSGSNGSSPAKATAGADGPSAERSGSPLPPGGGLMARRRGEGNGLLIDSGTSTPAGGNSKHASPQQQRSAGSAKRSPHTPKGQVVQAQDPDAARKSSAALPAQWQGGGTGDVQIKTPLWAPRLTPTRRGDDMYLAVAYAKREGIE